jgi:N-ethylmaleimide reductase
MSRLETLFSPTRFGAISMPNRIVMPPMTRMRSPQGVPTSLNAEYYAQRASAGLIVTEATAISAAARGYPNMPGIYTDDQAAGWLQVTRAVKAAGGRIVLQLVHHGRWSHSSYNLDGQLPVAPSAIAAPGMIYDPDSKQVAFETPRALDIGEIPQIVDAFRQGALRAVEAGFDAVEVHGANGFLIDQFLQDGSNRRADGYGGTVENRTRLLLEVLGAVTNAIGADRTGVRLSPHGNLGGLSDSDTVPHFSHIITATGKIGLAYLHLIEPRASSAGLGDDASIDSANNLNLFRKLYPGPVITAGGYSPTTGAEAILTADADAVAFGRMFISNPDLPKRIRTGGPLNVFDRSTSYGGGARGYTDYPVLQAVDAS